MAGRDEEARNSMESLSWPDTSRPIIGNQVPYGDPSLGYPSTPPTYTSPSGYPHGGIEDERPVPKWPYIVGAALLLVIPIAVIIAIMIV